VESDGGERGQEGGADAGLGLEGVDGASGLVSPGHADAVVEARCRPPLRFFVF